MRVTPRCIALLLCVVCATSLGKYDPRLTIINFLHATAKSAPSGQKTYFQGRCHGFGAYTLYQLTSRYSPHLYYLLHLTLSFIRHSEF